MSDHPLHANTVRNPAISLAHWARAAIGHSWHKDEPEFDDDQGRVVWQTSTMEALLAGIYDGDVTVGELLTHGNFGLGTFNALDGEMVILDGMCYHLKSDGTVTRAMSTDLTPFAVVTTFDPDVSFDITQPIDRAGIESLIDGVIPSKNFVVAVRMSGTFSRVDTRTVGRQEQPYPPLLEAAKHEVTNSLANVAGTMAGFRTPGFEQGISVAGYHLHFIDNGRKNGGHMLDFSLESGQIDLSYSTDVQLNFPRFGAFLTAQLDGPDIAKAIAATEGSGPPKTAASP